MPTALTVIMFATLKARNCARIVVELPVELEHTTHLVSALGSAMAKCDIWHPQASFLPLFCWG